MEFELYVSPNMFWFCTWQWDDCWQCTNNVQSMSSSFWKKHPKRSKNGDDKIASQYIFLDTECTKSEPT